MAEALDDLELTPVFATRLNMHQASPFIIVEAAAGLFHQDRVLALLDGVLRF